MSASKHTNVPAKYSHYIYIYTNEIMNFAMLPLYFNTLTLVSTHKRQ